MFRVYFYNLLRRYLSILIRPGDRVVEIDPANTLLVASMADGRLATLDEEMSCFSTSEAHLPLSEGSTYAPHYIVLGGNIHYERDVQAVLARVRSLCTAHTRLVITYYSAAWRPLVKLATFLGLRHKTAETNWLSHEDIFNLLLLEDFEPIKREGRIIFPVYIPLVSAFLNRFVAPLPFFRALTLVNILVARPLVRPKDTRKSVSIVVPARNEAGNIAAIVERIPVLSEEDEIIFVEGHSSDRTWAEILHVQALYAGERRILACRQNGKGKGDAVRMGFSVAKNDILAILDADMTVAPEDLPRFHQALCDDKGEFINGSRLVYPMEKKAMRFLNMLGNKFFAAGFSFILGQRFKDTLCGTKVISRENYHRLAANRDYFGDFDPFGDFDLIFGAARMGLKIVEVPIHYRERTYGDTNIARWRHGALLLAMLIFAARRLKFV